MTWRVNADRLAEEIARFGRIGATTDGGVTRLVFSEAEGEAVRLLADLLRAEGLSTRTDGVGNLFGLRRGSAPGLPVLMIGSHLDTVPHGGRFDGALGVIAALEVVRVLGERGIETRHPVEVVCFRGEEAARFGLGCLGSAAMAGVLEADRLLGAGDANGVTGEAALRAAGLSPEGIGQAIRPPAEVAAFVELHIEQGRVLEAGGEQAGIVTDGANYTRLKVTVTGQADHSGTTPMALRRDALLAASEMALAVEEAVGALGEAPSVGTVGVLRVLPCAVNVVPGRVDFEVDVRDVDFDRKARIVGRIRERVEEIARRRRVEAAAEMPVDGHPVKVSDRIVETIRRAAGDLGLRTRAMTSGAGHDALRLAPVLPAGMIFVPSRDGRSHCPEEHTDLQAVAPGVELLLETVLRLDRDG